METLTGDHVEKAPRTEVERVFRQQRNARQVTRERWGGGKTRENGQVRSRDE